MVNEVVGEFTQVNWNDGKSVWFISNQHWPTELCKSGGKQEFELKRYSNRWTESYEQLFHLITIETCNYIGNYGTIRLSYFNQNSRWSAHK